MDESADRGRHLARGATRHTRRTREHVLADLSANHVERFVLRRGHAVEGRRVDYGYDLILDTFDEDGQYENGFIYLQLKASDSLTILRDGKTVSLSLDTRHLRLWEREPMPVFLIVYDARSDIAYRLYVQSYLRNRAGEIDYRQLTATVHVPVSNVIDEAAIETFRQCKARVLRQIEEVNLHEQ